MGWDSKLEGESRYARTGSYVNENNIEISKERYEELIHISNLLVVDFLREQKNDSEVIPIDNDKYGRRNSKVLVEFKKKTTNNLLKRSKEGEFTIFEVSKISQDFSYKTRNFKNTYYILIDESQINECKKNLKKVYREMI